MNINLHIYTTTQRLRHSPSSLKTKPSDLKACVDVDDLQEQESNDPQNHGKETNRYRADRRTELHRRRGHLNSHNTPYPAQVYVVIVVYMPK